MTDEQTQAPMEPTSTPPMAPHKNKLLVVGVVVLVAVAAFFGGMAATNFFNLIQQDSSEDGGGYPVIGSEEEEEIIDEEVVEEEEDEEELQLVSTEDELVIDWIDPFDQPSVHINETLQEAYCPIERDSEGRVLQYQPCGTPQNVDQFRLGTVVGGEYDGRYLEMFTVRVEGLGYYHVMIYLLVDPDEVEPVVVLDQEGRSTSESFATTSLGNAISLADWSSADPEEVFAGMIIEETATIPDLQPETEIQDADGNTYFFTGAWLHYVSEKAISPLVSPQKVALADGEELTLYTAPEGSSTSAGKNQFYMLGKDGRFYWYDMEVPFYEYYSDENGTRRTQGVPAVTWNDGSVNEETYFKGAVGGCGFTTQTNVVDAEVAATLSLEVVGEADGYEIYEPASYDQEYYEDKFNVISYGPDDEDKPTYDDYSHPYIYFEDALGRWIEMQLDVLIPPVECGKPVIYLYPEEEMELSVWVEPKGGFSYTEPVYDGGWEVLASPNGELVNLKDGKQYHYLFWEGRGDLYAPVETYWVIAQEDVESFLITQLLKMNLNKMEIVDFLTFWLPRMQDDAYYKIGFHGTEVMDQLAPLSLSIEPDHTFRILMDYEGLDAWQESNPPTRLPQANRDGFEVIEWGGVLR